MLLTEAASVKLSRLKKILNFFSPLPHASLSLSETQKRKQATKSEAQSEIWISFPLSSSRLSLSLSQKHRNRSKQLDLKLGFKSCIEFKLWKQLYLWYLQSINIWFLFCNGDTENKDQRGKATSICICASRFPASQLILVDFDLYFVYWLDPYIFVFVFVAIT